MDRITPSYENYLEYVISEDGSYYFQNDTYGMVCRIYKEDIDSFCRNPYRKWWGSRSHSNNIQPDDVDAMKRFLCARHKRRYKTVTDVLKSRSKHKKEHLLKFTLSELLEYKTKEGGQTCQNLESL